MYISEFTCGIICTVSAQLALAIVSIVVLAIRAKIKRFIKKQMKKRQANI